MTRKLLIVAAHPDDEVLGCGGLVARTLREGGQITTLILTEGSTTQYPDRPELVEQKRAEARRCAELLGGGAVEFADLPDMELGTLAPALVNAPVSEAVQRLRPDWVLAHHGGDLNRDHQVVHEAARVACRPVGDAPVPRLLSYEVLSSTEWGAGPFVPTVYVALTDEDVDRKVAGFEAYKSEVRAWPHPRSAEAIRSLARTRGSQCGATAAEAFRLVWERL